MLLLLVACVEPRLSIGGKEVVDDPVDRSTVGIAGPGALDPLHGPATYTLGYGGPRDRVAVEVVDGSGAVVRSLHDGNATTEVTWDGRDAAGALVPRGAYTLRVTMGNGELLASDELDVHVVRVGVSAGTLGGDRIPLTWHADGDYQDGGVGTTFALATIDDGVAPTAIPEPWDDLWELPQDVSGNNIPAAYAWNARPTLSLVVSGDLAGADLSAAIEGWTLTSGDVAPGSTLVFTKDEAVATGPGVVEEALTLRWTAAGVTIGEQSVPLRIYALLGPPAFERDTVIYQPWVAVIDPALRAIQGVEATETAVTSALVEHIYRDLGLSYDTRWGASAYTQYDGGGWDDAHFNLTGFLDRSNGSVVNCTDCAAILEAFANMIGAALSYTILTPSFDLNMIQSIGGDHFTQCPFDGGGCGFSYHAVTTPDDGETIYDATLMLDGDADPGNLPVTELLVQAIPGEEYMDRLVEDGSPRYRYTQKETLQ